MDTPPDPRKPPGSTQRHQAVAVKAPLFGRIWPTPLVFVTAAREQEHVVGRQNVGEGQLSHLLVRRATGMAVPFRFTVLHDVRTLASTSE